MLSDFNGIRTNNHLTRKRTLNYLGQFGYVVVGSDPVAVS